MKKIYKFTLLELIITLGILAALSSLLLDNFADIKLREKESQNEEKGKLISNILTGINNEDGYSRFLSDMGKRPQILEITSGRILAQLYDRTIFYHNNMNQTMFNHTEEIEIDDDILDIPELTTFTFPTMQMNVGWNGPYINLIKSDNAKFFDAWGNDWKIITNYYLKNEAGKLEKEYTLLETPAKNAEIDGIASLGADKIEAGEEPADKDSYFFFSHDENLASLNVSLKVRDDQNPKIFNDLIIGSSTLYDSSKTYQIGNVVHVGAGINKKYYTCKSTTSSNPETTPDSWTLGLPANWISKDALRVLIFSPAEKTISSKKIMEAGFFRLQPFDSVGANNAIEYPVLRYSNNNNVDWATSSDPSTFEFGINRNFNRGRVKSNWLTTKSISNFKVEWLIPGKRKIYAFAGFYDSSTSKYYSFSESNIEWLNLKSGENYITMYLERKFR